MSDLGWRADGIERARAAGGIELETYRRPGFGSVVAVRRSLAYAGGSGATFEQDDCEDDWEYTAKKKRKKRGY